MHQEYILIMYNFAAGIGWGERSFSNTLYISKYKNMETLKFYFILANGHKLHNHEKKSGFD